MSPRRASIAAWGGPLVAVALALWITWPAWGPVPFNGIDVIAHLMRTVFGVEQLVLRAKLDGWSPGAFLGHQHFAIRGPGVTWLTALVRAATLGSLSTTAAFNAAVLGSFVLFPLGAVFLARSLGLDRTAAGLAGILSLAVANPFCNGLRGLFGLGLVEQQVGALVFVVALGALARLVTDPRPRWIVFAGVASAALVITHAPSTVVLPVVAALQLPWLMERGRIRGALGRLARAGVLALGLAAFWVLPFVAHRDLVALRIGHRDVPPLLIDLRDVVLGSLTYPPRVAIAVLAGWVCVLVFRRGCHVGLVVGPLAYLVLGHAYYAWSPTEVHEQVALRAAGYMGLVAIFPLAMLLALLTRSRAGEFAALAIAVGLVIVPTGPWRALARPYPTAPAPLAKAASVLRRIVPRGARFATPQRRYPAEIVGTGLAGPDRWLSWQSGRGTLNGLTRDSSSTPWTGAEAELMDTRPPAESADRLARLGVSHVVAPTDAVAASLAASPRFRTVWSGSPLTILEIVPTVGRPAPGSLVWTPGPARAHLQSPAAEHMRWKIATRTATDATIAVAWSPKWHATLDGVSVPLARTDDGLIRVPVPAGQHALGIDFRPDVWDRAGLAVTLGTLVAVLVASRQRR